MSAAATLMRAFRAWPVSFFQSREHLRIQRFADEFATRPSREFIQPLRPEQGGRFQINS